MTRDMMWIGFLATVLIVVVLGVAAMREPNRQIAAEEHFREVAVEEGTDLYAENCVICHGAAGEGLAAMPGLNNEGVGSMDYETLFRAIERGRYNTAMAAYGVDEGGIFTNAQIDSLIALVQYGSWNDVATLVAERGLTPPEVVVAEVSGETLALVRDLPEGDALANGLNFYAENCAACHGGNGEGTTLASALNSDELRSRLADADIARIISEGVPGTLMAAWGNTINDQESAELVVLLRRWDELDAAGVAMPVIETPPIDMSPEAIAEGEHLFNVLCTQCHGTDGYGSPMASALNSQSFLHETPDAAIQQIIALGVPGTSMPAWGGRLTEADIAALTAYLRSWEPTAPAIVAPSGNAGGGGPPAGRGGGPPWQQN